MSSLSSLSAFHHWLLEVSHDDTTPPNVLIVGDALSYPQLAADIAHHLNQFHDSNSGKWLALPTVLIEAIAADPSQRRLVGVDAACEKCPPTSACGIRKVIAAVAARGNCVLDSVYAAAATIGMTQAFRVSLSNPQGSWHVRLDPSLFPASCLAPIIGDIYLEWLECHCDDHPHQK